MNVSKIDTRPFSERSDAECKARIKEIRRRLNKLAGGEAIFGGMGGGTPQQEVAFLEHILQIEEEPQTTLAKMLVEEGVSLPPPGALNDDEIRGKLWEVISMMGRLRTYLSHTDHLDDRELYTALWNDHLNEPTWDLRRDPNSSSHLDILGGWSEEDMRINLTYYAGEDERAMVQADFPEDPLPEHKELPHDRDRFLPKSPHG